MLKTKASKLTNFTFFLALQPYANYTRLLTMSSLEKDDLASYIPTFVVKRDLPLQVRALNAKRWLLTFNL